MSLTRKTYAAVVAVLATLAVVLVLLFVPTNSAGAIDEPCVPKDAYTEVVVITPAVPAIPAVPGTPAVPAVTETIHHEAVPPVTETIPAVAEVWANWSPDNQQGPFTGPPVWPTDPRGTWHVHKKIPGGHEGPDGVYQQDNPGNGNADWFYRLNGQPEKVIVITEGVDAYDEVVVITPEIPAVPGTPEVPAVPAVTQEIFHPAVVCVTPSDTPTVVTETPVVTETVVPTPTPDDVVTPEVTPVPEEDETPVAVPEKEDEPKPEDKPQPVVLTTIECVDGVNVTTVTKNGNVVSVHETGSCDRTEVLTIPGYVKEEGL